MGKIAILLPDLRPGGAERLHVNLARAWIARGFEVEFVLRQRRGELLGELPRGATVVSLEASRVRGSVLPLSRYLRSTPPQALLAAMWPLTAVAALAARLAGFEGRVLGSEHSPLSLAYADRGRLHRWILSTSQRWAYPRLDAAIGVSAGVADDLARMSGLPRDLFKVIHNPAALGMAGVRTDVPLELASVPRPVFLTVGTLKRVKRQDILIDAFGRLAAHGRGTLCILGDGPERDALAAKVQALDLGDAVLMPGFVADPGPWYAAADVFVLSSEYEGFGNVIVEAMEHGLPIVSTDCVAGPAEILEGGKYGTLVPVGDAQALSEAMRDALPAPLAKAALQARAREFGLDVVAERYLDLLIPGWRSGAVA
ncbi:glycosyltransferase [Arenimonas sp. MALMAid1274]|uniref:glycosyltransferase n=1 Tax=Arenimonas sp. MALMAid1274 TaxID=3411630 RepID=UPI003BA1E62A